MLLLLHTSYKGRGNSMDNSSIESLKQVRKTNQDLLNFFNDTYIGKLEQVQSLKTEEFELKAKIDQLLKTLDVYSFKSSIGHNVFSPFSASTTSQQEKASQIELQLKELQDIKRTLNKQIKDEEDQTDLLKKRISDLSASIKQLDDLLSEVTEEVSTIQEAESDDNSADNTEEPGINHGINVLKLFQHENDKLAQVIHSNITDVLDSNYHKLEVLSWLIRSDMNRAKVTLEEISSSISNLADYTDELALSLSDKPDSEEPVWTVLERMFQTYKDEHPECSISYDIDCTDYAINIPAIVTCQLTSIMDELMTNVFKHSNANKIVIKIYLSSRLVDVYINDNGVGIDSNNISASPWYSGLNKIKEIIHLLDGTFKIDGDIVSGTNVRFSFPLQ